MDNYEPFKYATEAGVNFHLGPYQLCQQEDFKYLQDNEWIPFYNIYFICQRNRIAIQPKSLRAEDDFIYLMFDVYEEDSKFEVPIIYPNPFKTKEVTVESDYPYHYFKLCHKERGYHLIKSSHAVDTAREGIFPNPGFLDLEILYVGQTKRASKTPVIDRLISHQTLQEIYSQKRPDKDIYLLLGCFQASGAVEVRGTVRTQKKYEKEDIKRLKKFMGNRLELTREQQITIAEAALIRYFDPKYNEIYKKTFPKKSSKSYDEIFKMDLNAVSIEIDTSYHFFSEKVPTNKRHFERYFLSTDEERRKLFDYSVGFDTDKV